MMRFVWLETRDCDHLFLFRLVMRLAVVVPDADWADHRAARICRANPQCRAAWQPARHNIARKCLGLHDGDVWFARNGNQIIGGASTHVPGATPMKWQSNLMDSLSIDLKRSSPATNESARFNRAAQRNDANIIGIPN